MQFLLSGFGVCVGSAQLSCCVQKISRFLSLRSGTLQRSAVISSCPKPTRAPCAWKEISPHGFQPLLFYPLNLLWDALQEMLQPAPLGHSQLHTLPGHFQGLNEIPKGAQQFLPALAGFPPEMLGLCRFSAISGCFPPEMVHFCAGSPGKCARLRKVPRAGVRGAVAALGEVSRERGQ